MVGEQLKAFGKKLGRVLLIKLAIILIIILLVVVMFAVLTKTVMKKSADTVPEGSKPYFNEVKIDEEGKITTSLTPEELWEDLVKQGYQVDKYLRNPNELAKLMNAELITKLPDTRSSSEEKIDWSKLLRLNFSKFKKANSKDEEDKEENKVQGIIKFKRHNEDGSEYYLSYANPTEYYGWIEEYNATGSAQARENALKHFTLKKTKKTSSSGGTNLAGIGDGTITDISEKIVEAANNTPTTAGGRCLEWVDNVYDNAGVGADRTDTAYLAWKAHGISQDKNSIPIGAAVYGTGSGNHSGCGHVGIYLGSGKVIDSAGEIRIQTLEEWISWQVDVIEGHQGWLGWGWEDGNRTRGTTADSTAKQSDDKKSKDKDKSKSKKDDKSSTPGVDLEPVVQAALSQLGKPYNTAPSAAEPDGAGFNCSGLVWWAFEQGGFEVPHAQCAMGESSPNRGMIDMVYENCGGSLITNQSDLKRGDVLFYNTGDGRESGHVAIYLGDGKRVHADGTSVAEDDRTFNPAFIGGGPLIKDGYARGGSSDNGPDNSIGYQAVVATRTQITKSINYNGNNVEDAADSYGVSLDDVKPEDTLNTTNIDYESMVEPYTLQFDFLWTLLTVGHSKNFVMDLADLAYNSEIEVGVYDNLTTTTDVDKWTYKQITDAKIRGTVSYGDKSNSVKHNHYYSKGNALEEGEEEYITRTIVTRTNSVVCALTKADTWIASYEIGYDKSPEETNTQSNSQDLKNKKIQDWTEVDYTEDNCGLIDEKIKEIVDEVNREISAEDRTKNKSSAGSGGASTPRYIDEDDVTKNITMKTRVKRVDQKNITEDTIVTDKYSTGTEKGIIKDDYKTKPNFVTLFNSYEHRQNRHNILSATSWIFEMMEENENLSNTLEIFKYLLYKATNVNYGVTKFDFKDLLSMFATSSSRGGSGGLLSVTEPSLSREEFIRLVQSYGPAISNPGTQEFRDGAGTLYDVCVREHINPVLCAAQAWAEQSWSTPVPGNYWGIGVFNGMQDGIHYEGIAGGAKGYCNEINSRIRGENSVVTERLREYEKVDSRYNSSFASLYDVISSWAWADNDDALSWKERAEHDVEYTDTVVQCASQIFGEGVLNPTAGSSSAAGSDLLSKAQWCLEYAKGWGYLQNSELNQIPLTNSTSHTIDCSSYVCWVLYEYGYKNFGGYQQDSGSIGPYTQSLGWQQRPATQAQPGDILVYSKRYHGSGHVEIYAGGGKVYNGGQSWSIGVITPGPTNLTYPLETYDYAIVVPQK